MKYQKGSFDFDLGDWIIIMIIVCVAIGFLAQENSKQHEADEKVKQTTSQKVTDSDILKARNDVIEFEARSKRVQEYVSKCLSDIPNGEYRAMSINNCTILAYDTNGVYRNGNAGSDDQMATEEKDTYVKNLEISKLPLSTEMN